MLEEARWFEDENHIHQKNLQDVTGKVLSMAQGKAREMQVCPCVQFFGSQSQNKEDSRYLLLRSDLAQAFQHSEPGIQHPIAITWPYMCTFSDCNPLGLQQVINNWRTVCACAMTTGSLEGPDLLKSTGTGQPRAVAQVQHSFPVRTCSESTWQYILCIIN